MKNNPELAALIETLYQQEKPFSVDELNERQETSAPIADQIGKLLTSLDEEAFEWGCLQLRSGLCDPRSPFSFPGRPHLPYHGNDIWMDSKRVFANGVVQSPSCTKAMRETIVDVLSWSDLYKPVLKYAVAPERAQDQVVDPVARANGYLLAERLAERRAIVEMDVSSPESKPSM